MKNWKQKSNMKTFARLLALLLACIMCLFVVVACTDDGDDDDDDGYDPTRDINGRLKDDLPDDLNYFREEITTLYWDDVENPEFEIEKITGDNVRDAIFQRNENIEDRLKVTLKWDHTPGNVNKRAAFVKKVESIFNAGTQSYDLIASYSRTEGMLAIQNYLIDLNKIENSYINYSQPWWPKALTDTVRIGNSVYFLSGDCSTNVLYLMYTIFFNKDLLNRHYNNEAQANGFEDATAYLYDMVYQGKWTLDRLIEFTSGVGNDPSGDGKTVDDYYGFSTVNYHVDAFYTGSNMSYVVQKDGDELLAISKDYGSKKTVALVSKLGAWLTSNDCWATQNESGVSYTRPFTDGKCVFHQNRVQIAEKNLPRTDISFGLVPTPKYDDKQVNYYSVVGNPFTLYGIFSDCKIRGNQQETWSMLSAVMECWCSEGYRLTTPEVFEVNMQLKYSETQDETNMFEEVRSSITFDLGRIFTNDLSFMSELPSKAAVSNSSWATSYAAYKRVLKKQLETIVDTLHKNGVVVA